MSILPKIFRASLMCLALVIGVAQICPANPIVAVTTSNGGNATNNQAQTIGWAFTTTSNINVTALGLFDAGANGLADPHEIGLWTNSGTLLSMLTIPEGTGTTLVNGFRFVNITPIALQANQTYVVGAFYRGQPGFGGGAIDPDPDQDSFVLSTDSSSFSYASGINFAGDRTSGQPISNIMFPGSSTGVFQAFLGPDFLFEPQLAAPVPEPATLALLGTGLIGLAGTIRRKGKANKLMIKEKHTMSRVHKFLAVTITIAALAFVAPFAKADTLVIGGNNSNNGYPFGRSNLANAYQAGSEYQQIYAASQFPGTVTITQIAFSSVDPGANNYNFRVGLGTTSSSTASPNPSFAANGSTTTVFTGPLAATLSGNNSFDLVTDVTQREAVDLA